MEVRSPRAKTPGGDRPLFQGTPADVIADIRAYQALGVTHFVFDPTVQDLKAVLANMERFAHDVRPKVARAPRA
jgi:alkanesulfonate monooxygenase SsuD/methylene tetrahydromethanopterin reductase-like flavin-dependent oxidoreductase (luciferase family)